MRAKLRLINLHVLSRHFNESDFYLPSLDLMEPIRKFLLQQIFNTVGPISKLSQCHIMLDLDLLQLEILQQLRDIIHSGLFRQGMYFK